MCEINKRISIKEAFRQLNEFFNKINTPIPIHKDLKEKALNSYLEVAKSCIKKKAFKYE